MLEYVLEPPDRQRQRRSLETARLALNESAEAAAWKHGLSLSLPSVEAEAQAVLARVGDLAGAPTARSHARGG